MTVTKDILIGELLQMDRGVRTSVGVFKGSYGQRGTGCTCIG